jgi:uncharacterized protein YciI
MPSSLFLCRIRPVRPDLLTAGPTPAEKRLIDAHFAYLKRLADDGVVLCAGRTATTDAESHGLILFRAPDDAAARRLMASDPALAGGVFASELFPFRLAIVGAAFRDEPARPLENGGRERPD